MKQYTTVIFDLDGTLLDTLADLADGVNMALRLHGFPEHTTREVCMAVGNGVVRLMEQMVPDGKNNPDFEACLATFRTEYAKIARNKT
ncbi:MAG: HAD hydrolase-like protein, partial [Clostridia bacterium]|nr:HAD hydrolase-like protein [Clostridia bacterium]